MPTTKSALKRIRTSEKSRVRNKSKISEIKTLEKKLRATLESDPSKAREVLGEVCAKLDKAAKTGAIHKNKASRKKSRLALLLNKSAKK